MCKWKGDNNKVAINNDNNNNKFVSHMLNN